MLVNPTPLHGAVVLQMEPIEDSRGYFARSFCKRTLEEYGIAFDMVQSNVAFNHSARTLRGMHFQRPPYAEAKIVSCIQGALYDVIIDLRADSPTYGRWFGITLTPKSGQLLYIPTGFAHGYQTLEDRTAIHYMVSEYYTPTHEAGVRWNDPAFSIEWPYTDNLILSPKDERWGGFDPRTGGMKMNGGDGYGEHVSESADRAFVSRSRRD